MIKILIVEDDTNKLKKITQALTEIKEIDIDQIKNVNNSHEAKILLENSNFDLLILDIAIPKRINSDVEQDEGLKLLEELKSREKYNLPTHIVGITGYEDLYEANSEKFAELLKSLVYYDPSTDSWSQKLKEGIKLIISSKMDTPPDSGSYNSRLVVVCALETLELKSLLRINWDWKEIQVPNDATRYYEGSFKRDDKIHKVYAAAASRMGMPMTAILSAKMTALFKPEYIAMTGITAGVSNKTNYGDIVVAETSWDWGSGKWIVNENKELKFQPSPYYLPLSIDLKNKFLKMKDDSQALNEIRQNYEGEKPESILAMKLGPIASGASVLADGNTVQRILAENRDLLGIEMEVFSIFALSSEAPIPRPTPFALKSVVDFADGEKNDKFQKYAAYTSTQALKLFMEKYI